MRRLISEKRVRGALAFQPAVALLGPRQAGKTWLARKIANIAAADPKQENDFAIYLDMERSEDRRLLAEPLLFLESRSERLVVIDEVQMVPELFQSLRVAIDQDRRPGRFLLLGSASKELLRQSSESLAGRIAYEYLTPFALEELNPVQDQRAHWLRGGFPESFLAETTQLSFRWRQDFVSTYIDRDLPAMGIQIAADNLRRFWQLLAHNQGQLWNASACSTTLELDKRTVGSYLELLEDLLLVRRLSPYFANLKKRLVKSPKVYVRDSGIHHTLLGLDDLDALERSMHVGPSWENYVIEQIIPNAERAFMQACFYRTHAGTEIDLVLLKGGQPHAAIEIKRTLTPKITRGMREALKDLDLVHGYVVYPGKHSYPMDEQFSAVSVFDLEALPI